MIKYEHPIFKNYFANELGEVFNPTRKLKGTKATAGYWQYEFRGKTYLAHRFVYECVHNTLLCKGDVINHLDHNKVNNNIVNLEKTTPKGNAHHYQSEVGRFLIQQPDMSYCENLKDSSDKRHKLTKLQASELIKLSLQGVENSVLSDMFGVHERYVSLIRHKKRWKWLWVELGLESSETIPSGSRPASAVEAESTLPLS